METEVEAIRNGNEKAFEDAYYRWHQKIYAYILHKTSSADTSEEVVQQVFVRLWEKREELSVHYSLSIQLFRMARTILIDELRKAAHARTYKSFMELKGPAVVNGDLLEYKDTLKRVEEAINQMPPVRQRIFKMSRFEYKSYREIAEELSLSSKTVENHISLALKFLKKIIPIFFFFSALFQ
ncbi:RNA polymerase sigma-70 factor, ECF subfamily [bacterium A37T11]|nr:RNA polymerase sigma-70 factor, ECF subfamily [bacterium A37T11]